MSAPRSVAGRSASVLRPAWASASSSTGRDMRPTVAIVSAARESRSSDSTQLPNASASPVPIGTGSGNGINPLSSSSVRCEQAESMAEGLPPVDRHSSESTEDSSCAPVWRTR